MCTSFSLVELAGFFRKITPYVWPLLIKLKEEKSLSLEEVERALGRKRTLSLLRIRFLVKNGLVKRGRDGKKRKYTLTEKGERIIALLEQVQKIVDTHRLGVSKLAIIELAEEGIRKKEFRELTGFGRTTWHYERNELLKRGLLEVYGRQNESYVRLTDKGRVLLNTIREIQKLLREEGKDAG